MSEWVNESMNECKIYRFPLKNSNFLLAGLQPQFFSLLFLIFFIYFGFRDYLETSEKG